MAAVFAATSSCHSRRPGTPGGAEPHPRSTGMSEESLRTSGILLAVFGSPWTVVLRRHPTSSRLGRWLRSGSKLS